MPPRKPKTPKSDPADLEREKRIRAALQAQSDRATALRNQDREFHGLQREFVRLQRKMISDYMDSKDLHHARDLGDQREEILRIFLLDSGYLSPRFRVSDRSVRVASPTGHISPELDIVLYDAADTVSLMRRGDTYEVLPVESVYGVIQVKSKLTKAEIGKGLANIAAFKALQRPDQTEPRFNLLPTAQSTRGFGLLFAYDSDMDWLDIVEAIKSFTSSNLKSTWCNAIVILKRGIILRGQGNAGWFRNEDLEAIHTLAMYGLPEREELTLYGFYSILLELCRMTEVSPPGIANYFRLPLVSGKYSYNYNLAQFAEVATCGIEGHGDYQRTFVPAQLEKVVDWCMAAEPVNWVKANNIAYGLADDPDAYARQPGDIRIYNPDSLPLPEILLAPASEISGRQVRGLGYDLIQCAGMNIAAPYYYEQKEGLLVSCPKCAAVARRRGRRRPKPPPAPAC